MMTLCRVNLSFLYTAYEEMVSIGTVFASLPQVLQTCSSISEVSRVVSSENDAASLLFPEDDLRAVLAALPAACFARCRLPILTNLVMVRLPTFMSTDI